MGIKTPSDPSRVRRQNRRLHRHVRRRLCALALELGVAPDRIDPIIDFAAAAKHGVKMEGNSAAAMPRCLQNSTPVGVDEPRDCEAYGPNLSKGSYLSPTRIYQSCCKPPTHPAGIWLAPVARTLIADRLKA